ncbi:MAG: hypothetical protein ACREL5_07055, partial [Gemmatimonadales bacterium]
MRGRILAVLAMATGLAVEASAQTQIPNPDAAYTSSTTLLPITVDPGSTFGSVSGGGWTLTFSSDLTREDAPGGGWATWSCDPYSERPCDSSTLPVGTLGSNTITMTLSSAAQTFGFEAEPNIYATEDMLVEFYLGATPVYSFDQFVNGDTGARLFALTGASFDKIV